MDENSGERWSKIYISDLTNETPTAGRWQIPVASLPGEDEVRQKAKELGLVERRKIW